MSYIPVMATQMKRSDADDEGLLEMVEAALQHDDGAAAAAHLAAGRPIYYSETDTPSEAVIKEYPDGSRALISFDRSGRESVIRELA